MRRNNEAPRAWFFYLLLSLRITPSLAYTRPERFLIISSPEKHKVYYAQLPSLQTLTLPRNEREANVIHAEVLIDGEYDKCTGWGCSESSNKGLDTPYGVAVHQACGTATLYVSDSKAGAIFGYELYTSAFGGITVGSQKRIREGIEGGVKWLAVDGHGNLFYTSENGGKVFMISTFKIANRTDPPVVVYSADGSSGQTEGTAQGSAEGGSTAAPAGLASDGFQLYWADEEGDENSGAVVGKRFSQQLADPTNAGDTPAAPPRKLTTGGGISRRMAINVCLARDNVFFTGEGNSLLAVKSNGSTIQEVAPGFKHPQGCAYDGEGTLYVADDETQTTSDEDQSSNETEPGQGYIYSLAANLVNLRGVRYVTKVVAVEKPQQLAIFAGIADSVKCSTPSSAVVGQVAMGAASDRGQQWHVFALLTGVLTFGLVL